jgi:ABC-type branched-subunit amino acid transport system ATPase component/branched-subunit amino acid ABC-type transport system permease component
MADQLAIFVILGLGIGVVYAGLGLSLLVTYRGANVINFAIGAVAMWGGYVYYGLRSAGRLYFPVVGVPSSISVGGPVPLWVAIVGGVASAAALNLVAQVVIFRPLRRAPDLAKIVASVGLMLLVQAVAVVAFGSQQLVAPPILPSASLSLGGTSAPWSDVVLLGIVAAVTGALAAYFRFARSGLAMQGVAEKEASVALVGRSPSRLAAGAWALSGALAGLFGVLIAPLVGLNTVSDTLYVVPALAVVLVGRLRSLTVTCLAGVALGVFQSIVDLLKTMPWYPGWAQNGVDEALPLVVIVVVLAFFGHRLPTRNDAATVDLPAVVRPRHPWWTLGALSGAAIVAVFALSGIYRFGVVESIIAAIVMLSFVVLTGYAGQISLAQLAIAGAGGVFVAKLTTDAGVPFPLAPLLAALAAAACGLVVAIPALRIRGMQLAIVTLAFAVTIEQFLFANSAFDPPDGLTVRPPRLFGLDLAVRAGADVARASFGVLVVVVFALVAGCVLCLARSRVGLQLLAVRANERAAASIGIGVTGAKLVAFALASFLAGLGGAFLTYSTGQFSASSFDALAAGLPFLAFAYLGGITSVPGATIAAILAPAGILYVTLNRYVNNLGPYYLVVSGAALVVAAIAYPSGLTGTVRQLLGRPRAAAAPALALSVAGGRRVERPATTERTAAHMAPDTGPCERRAATSAVLPLKSGPPADTGTTPALAARDLRIAYGAAVVVDDVAFTLEAGTVTALIGPNGAGKTSILDALTGFVPASGSVRLGEDEVLGRPPADLVRRGLVRTWQAPPTFGDLTVGEDLSVAVRRSSRRGPAHRGPWRQAFAWRRARCHEGDDPVERVLELLDLGEVADRATVSLSLGHQKLVAVGRALVTAPKVLLLDEPAAGLDNGESRLLASRLGAIAGAGVAVLLVEHDMDLVFGVSSRVLVLHMGGLIAAGHPAEVRADVAVRRAYLGHGAGVASPRYRPVVPTGAHGVRR